MKEHRKARRQFLKNMSLASLSFGLMPIISRGNSNQIAPEKSPSTCNSTTLDYYGEGPFYTPNAPVIQNNLLADVNEPGERLIISGQVRNLDCTEVIADTVIDIWHADDAGQYDNAGNNLRGKIHTNSQGFYMFETILPGHYLNGNNFRPSHIHIKITPPGFGTITTQLYFQGDQYIPTDAAASIASGQYDATDRIIPITLNADGKHEGSWDIIVDGDGTLTADELHLEKGMIYSANPNPFSNKVEINYGVFREERVSLFVYDLQGRVISKLEERMLTPDKYKAVWLPDSSLPKGYYFIALKVNDLQIHYLKILKAN